MSEISAIKATDGTSYDIKDNTARNKLDNLVIPTKTSQLENDSGFLNGAPVASVNGKTGAVELKASDVGAMASDQISMSLSGTTLTITTK